MFHRVDDGLISGPYIVIDDDETPSGHKVNPTCASVLKKVLARAERAPGQLGPPEQSNCCRPVSAPPAQVVISSGMLCICLGEEKRVSCSNPGS